MCAPHPKRPFIVCLQLSVSRFTFVSTLMLIRERTATVLTFFLLAVFDVLTTSTRRHVVVILSLTHFAKAILAYKTVTLLRQEGWHVLRASGIFTLILNQGEHSTLRSSEPVLMYVLGLIYFL